MPGLSFRKIISLSELLNASLKPQLTDMPHLKQDSDDLDNLITNAKALDQEQQAITGRLRELVRLRKQAEVDSNDLRSRVAAQLRGKLGFTNENLLAFGIKPRKRSRQKAAAQPVAVKPPVPPPHTTTPSAAPDEPAKP